MTRDWRAQAKCRGQAPDFDYSVDGETPTERQQRLDAAVRTCHRCPVRAACEADIDRTMDDGVRAGMVLDKIRNVRAGGGFGDVVGRQGKDGNGSARREVVTGKQGDRNSNLGSVRQEVVLELTRQGLSSREIAERLRVTQRSVVRHRSAAREQGVA